MRNLFLPVAVLALAFLVCAWTQATVFGAQAENTIVITITQATSPTEATVNQELQLHFNINVSDQEGLPLQLDAPVDISAEIPAFTDDESGLSVLAVADQFHLPTGFTGGTRKLITAVTGSVPRNVANLSTPVTFTTVAPDTELVVPDTARLQVRAEAGESDGGFDFCIAPGHGIRGDQPTLFNNFRRALVVAHVSAARMPSATVLAGVQIDLVELIDDAETPQSDITVEVANSRVIDSDGDGFAEGINLVLRLLAAETVPVAINLRREFRLRVSHTDGINLALLGEADFGVEARERTSVAGVAVVGSDLTFMTRIERRQSRAFSLKPKVARNGVSLNAAARATLMTLPDAANGTPDNESGLFDLTWEVVADWPRLQLLVPWQLDDTLTISANMPGPDHTAGVTWDVAFAGVNATIFKTPESLTEKQYDGNVTEQDHVDVLVAAIKAAGLVAQETDDGNEIEIPTVASDPAEEYPNWDRVAKALRVIQEAVKAYKTAPRILDGQDCIANQKQWNVCATVQCPLLDKNGVPAVDSDGNPRLKDINLKIFFNPQRKGRDGEDSKGDDGGMPCTLLIVIAQCGIQESGNAGDGGNADATVTGRGSVGIAIGGDGSSNANTDSSAKGGNGGTSTVKVGNKPQKAADGPGSTGISIGGKGGDTVGSGQAGNGGFSMGTGEKGADGSVVARGGDSGSAKFPPGDGGGDGGEAKVSNPDSLKGGRPNSGKAERKNQRRSGKMTGGIARGEPDRAPDSAGGSFIPDPNPGTGG